MTLNIYQRINEVRKAVDYIQKDKKVEGYMAVTHDSVTALVRPHLVEHGVVIVPACIVKSSTVLTGTTTKTGTPFVRFEVVYRFDVVNADEPSDRFQAEIEAHALDHGDKAPGKALSYAKKALMLKLLEIESGEGEEERAEQHKAQAKSVAREAWDSMPKAQKSKIADFAALVTEYMGEGEDGKAYEEYEEAKAKLDTDEQVAFWSCFTSEQRATIKRLGDAHKKAAATRKAAKEAA